jgi:RNA polymerase sigma-70 factor (ECF subfamily)
VRRATKSLAQIDARFDACDPTNMSRGLVVYRYVTAEILAMTAAQEPGALATADTTVLDLFDRHHRRLYLLARRLTATADDARDLVQDTFLRVARASRSAPHDSSAAEAWLVQILVNVCRDQWRAKATRRRLDAQFLPTSDWVKAPGDPETTLTAQATVWWALRQLAPRRRATIVLYELEGVGIAEIGRLLGVSPVTVRWHLSRGRNELARVITALEGERR